MDEFLVKKNKKRRLVADIPKVLFVGPARPVLTEQDKVDMKKRSDKPNPFPLVVSRSELGVHDILSEHFKNPRNNQSPHLKAIQAVYSGWKIIKTLFKRLFLRR